jgi:hypothetical protein
MISYKIAPLPRASVLGQDAGIAQMAELVDALGSGPSGGNTVEVRVLFWAPRFKTQFSSSRHPHIFLRIVHIQCSVMPEL